MDLLLQEIAKTFNITNESISLIIQNYPELKQQYIINLILTDLLKFLSLTMAIPIISFFFSWVSVDKYTPEDEKRKSIKIQKYSIVALVTNYCCSSCYFKHYYSYPFSRYSYP